MKRKDQERRTYLLINRQKKAMRIIAFIQVVTSVFVILAYGRFENEFIRIAFLLAAILFSAYSSIHYVIRIAAMVLNFIVIVFFEYHYLRELLMQVACWERGSCMGGSSFEQLLVFQKLHINNGQILVDSYISPFWMQVQFWRTVLAISMHSL
jgi:hypothetical protein